LRGLGSFAVSRFHKCILTENEQPVNTYFLWGYCHHQAQDHQNLFLSIGENTYEKIFDTGQFYMIKLAPQNAPFWGGPGQRGQVVAALSIGVSPY